MSVDSLKQFRDNPNINREDVEIASEVGIEDRVSNGTGSKDQDFGGMGIFSCKTKRRRVLVMNFVDILVEEASIEKNATSHQGQLLRCSQGSTYPSSERNPPRRILKNHSLPRGKGHLPGCHVESSSDAEEQPDLQK